MRVLIALCSLLVMIGSAFAVEGEQLVGDFSLFDQHGELHQMSEYKDRRGIVLLTSSNECPISPEAVSVYAHLESRFFDLGFDFMLLNFGSSKHPDGVDQQIRLLDSKLPILMDESQAVSESLGVRRIDEVLVFDPKIFKVIYRGAVDRNLEVALYSILAGQEVMNSVSNVSGCELKQVTGE